jgi:hypothetical protein
MLMSVNNARAQGDDARQATVLVDPWAPRARVESASAPPSWIVSETRDPWAAPSEHPTSTEGRSAAWQRVNSGLDLPLVSSWVHAEIVDPWFERIPSAAFPLE